MTASLVKAGGTKTTDTSAPVFSMASLLDGGVRRGSDVVKALCLGADAVLVGRPLVYGLAARGEDGVLDVLRILREELERTLILMGCPGVADLDPSWLIPRGQVVAA